MINVTEKFCGLTASRAAAGGSLRQWLGRCLLGIVLAVPAAAPALAATAVSGSIALNATWAASQSPYQVTGDVTIDAGATLTIEAGVTVYMAAGTSLSVQTGSIKALGSAASPIKVLSDKTRLGQAAAPGDWNQWVFTAGAVNAHLDHIQFSHGRGLAVRGAAVVFDNLTIDNQQGAAIASDLAASITGAGNQATGNILNAVTVPAGEILGTTRFGLRGIPYLIQSGTLSVGKSPRIDSVTPVSILAGDTLTLTVTGSRLTGAIRPTWSLADLSSEILPGGTDTQFQMNTSAALAAAGGLADLTVLTDAGEVTAASALTVQRNQPRITSISPGSVYTLAANTVLSITGAFIAADSVVQVDGQTLPTAFDSSAQVRATLLQQMVAGTRSVSLRTPDPMNAGAFLTSNSLSLSIVQAQASFDPASASMVAGGAQTVTVRLPFPAPAGDLEFYLTSDAPAIATVPASVVIPEGASSADLTVHGAGVGQTQIRASRSDWATASLPVSVIAAPVTLNYTPVTSYLVGVTVGAGTGQTQTAETLASVPVGVVVGPYALDIIPAAGVVGTQVTLSIRGQGLNGVTSVEFLPADGLTVGAPVVSGDARTVTVPVTIDAAATKGLRKLVLKTSAGNVPFARPAGNQFLVTAPIPELDSITPQVILAGAAPVTLTVRGRNLRDLTSVRFEPAQGISALGSLTANADGTQMTFSVQADAGATSGPRTLVVIGAAGESSAAPTSGNTIQVAHAIGANFRDLSSPVVGVVVGSASSEPTTLAVGPLVSAAVGVVVGQIDGGAQTSRLVFSSGVGVVVGSGAIDMTPKAGVVGTTVVLTIQGQSLGGVTTVRLLPADGIGVGAPVVSANGNQITVSLTIDAAAAKTIRRVVLQTATNTVLPFVVDSRSQFLVTSPVPEIDSISPQVLLPGQSSVNLTVRGRNLRDVTAVRFDPAQGIAPTGLVSIVNADATQIQVSVNVAADAAVGPRTLIAIAAGGESTSVASPANTVQIAGQIGGAYSDLVSPLVGVVIAPAPSAPLQDSVFAQNVGVVVGPVVATMSPAGAIKGSSGNLVFTGFDLGAVSSASLVPTAAVGDVTLGTPAANAEGTEVTVPYGVSASAPSGTYRLILSTGSGASSVPVLAPNPQKLLWRVLDQPTLSSFSPLVLQQGRAYGLVVRGTNLKEVTRIRIEPAADLAIEETPPTWASDAMGETLTVHLLVGAAAATGPRVIRLECPGGLTSGQSDTNNTLSVTTP